MRTVTDIKSAKKGTQPASVIKTEREPVIKLARVKKEYHQGRPVLDNISFDIYPGEFVTVIGPSGVGKSTLLKLLIREEKATDGIVEVLGHHIESMPDKEVPFFRRKIGVVFQDFKLLPKKTVYENVGFALEVSSYKSEDIAQIVPKVLDLVGLLDKRDAFPHLLSGGEQQRVSIARAIARAPRLLIADEPTGNLDPKTAWEIIQLLVKINDLGTTVLLTTHNRDIVNALERRVLTLDAGQIVKDQLKGRYAF